MMSDEDILHSIPHKASKNRYKRIEPLDPKILELGEKKKSPAKNLIQEG
jgi:hypothetical protein